MPDRSEDQTAILSAYTELARKIWEDEDYAARALADPRTALAENGWEVPEGTEVRLDVVKPDDAPAEDLGAEEIFKGWMSGIEAGELRIVIPSEPTPSEALTLSDEELAGISGGEYEASKRCRAPSKLPPEE